MEFKKFITESKETTAAFAFGRFNPPTVGHEKLINKLHSVAQEHGAHTHVVASHSEGTSKDPLPQKAKLGYIKKAAPKGVKVSGSSKEHPTFLHAAAKLHSEGHKHLIMVAGSDRVDHYDKLLHQYNNVQGKHGHYNFKSIKVVSAGQRDPDAEGVEGMSGTKMRAHAKAGEMKEFKSGLPKALHPHAEEIANHIKSIKEDRETYIAGNIFKIGDIVESNNGQVGEIVYRGTTYVTIQLESGNTTKHWLKDIKESNQKIFISPMLRTHKSKQVAALFLPKDAWDNYPPENDSTNAYTATQMGEGFATSYIPSANKKAPTLGKDGKMYSAPAGHIVTTGTTPDESDLIKSYGNHDPLAGIKIKQLKTAKAAENPPDVLQTANPTVESIRQNFPQTKLRTMGQTLNRGMKKMNSSITHPDKKKKIIEDIAPTHSLASIGIPQGKTLPIDPTAHRDNRYTPAKEVYNGIDIPIYGQGIEGKPLGLVSFKSYMADPSHQGLEAIRNQDRNAETDSHERLAAPSRAYEMMRKNRSMGN